jgi:N-acetylmuramoyl-L-alanine amidase
MKPIEAHIPINANSRPGELRPLTRAIIYHWTGVPRQTAEQAGAYFASLAGTDNYASAHYVVDDNVYEFIPPREIAYHAGGKRYRRPAKDIVGIPPWRFAVGIELCVEDKTGRMAERTIRNGLELGKKLCLDFDLDPIHCIYRHHDMTGKICPKWFVEHVDQWTAFVGQIQRLVELQIEFDYKRYKR